jgi:acyl carrier protein
MRHISNATVRAQIYDFLVALSGESRFAGDENLVEAGILQSIHILECIHYLTETFSVKVRAEDLFAGSLTTLDRMVALVVSRKPTADALAGGTP